MNGRLHNIVRSPLMRNSYLHNGEPSNRQNKKESKKRGDSGDLSVNWLQIYSYIFYWKKIRTLFQDRFPRTVLFDESSETYRCLCSCFHVKTGAYFIAGLYLGYDFITPLLSIFHLEIISLRFIEQIHQNKELTIFKRYFSPRDLSRLRVFHKRPISPPPATSWSRSKCFWFDVAK